MDYSKLTFPAYVYSEFPKWVSVKGARRIVHNAEEEARAFGRDIATDVIDEAEKVEPMIVAPITEAVERIKRKYTRRQGV